MKNKIIILLVIFLKLSNIVDSQRLADVYLEKLFLSADAVMNSDLTKTSAILDSIDNYINYNNRSEYLPKAFIFRGNLYKTSNDFKTAEKYYGDADKIIFKNNSNEEYITLLANRGNNYVYLKQFDKANSLSDYVIHNSKKPTIFNYKSNGLAYFTKGYICVQNGDIAGIEYFKKSEEYALKSNARENLGVIYFYLAILNKKINEQDKVIENCEKADKIFPENNINKHTVLNVWAQALHSKGQTDKAEVIYKRIIETPNVSKRIKAFALNSYGILLKDSERYDEAQKVLLEGLEYAKEINLPKKQAEYLANLGGISFDKKEYGKANEYYRQAKLIYFDEGVEVDLSNKITLMEMLLRTSFAEDPNYKDLDQYVIFRDSFDRKNEKEFLANYLTKYEDEKKMKEILALKNTNLNKELENSKLNQINTNLERINLLDNIRVLKQTKLNDSISSLLAETSTINKGLVFEQNVRDLKISNQKIIIYLAAFSLCLISLLSALLYRQSKKRQQLNKTLSTQKDQIKLLNRELNHRVKNNLAFMTSLLEMQGRRTESPEAKEALRESESRLNALALVHSQLFRSESDTEVNLKNYLQEVSAHLKDIFVTTDKPISFDTDYTDFQINAEDAMRLGLIVNELVTNSVKHAFKNVPNPHITISTKMDSTGKLTFKYKDNGLASNTRIEENIPSESLGLKLISLLKKQLGDRYVVMV